MSKLRSVDLVKIEIVSLIIILLLCYSVDYSYSSQGTLNSVGLNGNFVTDWWVMEKIHRRLPEDVDLSHTPPPILEDFSLDLNSKGAQKNWHLYRSPDSVVRLFGGHGDKKVHKKQSQNQLLTAYAYQTLINKEEKKFCVSLGSTDEAKLWLNGHVLEPTDKQKTPNFLISQYWVNFPVGENRILISIPHEQGHGGFTFQIGGTPLIQAKIRSNLVRETTIFQFSVLGFSLALGILHFFIFLFYRSEYENLYYAIYVLFSGFTFFLWFSSAEPYLTHPVTIFYASLSISWLAALRFVYSVSLHSLPRQFYLFILLWVLVFISKIPLQLNLVNPQNYDLFQRIYHITAIAQLIEMFRVMANLYQQKKERSGILILGIFIFELTIFYNILIDFGVLKKQSYSQLIVAIGYAFNLVCYSIFLAREVAINNRQLHTLNKKLTQINEAIFRFVPRKMLHYIGEEDIVSLSLSAQKQHNMTVLFADVRDFTTLSEGMSPSENFNFINVLLNEIGPIIRQENGFIDKYMGDAIMALFPESADDAVRAGTQILETVKVFNEQRQSSKKPPIKMGVGIHTGELMLGIIGESERIEGTVISDVVNISARLEGLTKRYGCEMLVSQETLELLSSDNDYRSRFVERVKVKGRQGIVNVYEIYDADSEKLKASKAKTHNQLQVGISHYYQADFDTSTKVMKDILLTFPEDPVARLYLHRSKHYLQTGVPDNWSGIFQMEHK